MPQQQGNGGSFAQKQQMQANPMMQGRPGMSQGFSQPSQSMRPNQLTGQRPGMQSQNTMSGMAGPNKMRSPIGGSMGQQSYPIAPLPTPPPAQEYPQMKQGGMMPPGYDPNEPRAHDMGPNNIGGGFGMTDPRARQQFEQLMQGGVGRPDIMPRIGPSNPMQQLYGSTPGMQAPQPMQQQPMQMDENGLEARRGPR